MDREAWQAVVHAFEKGGMRLNTEQYSLSFNEFYVIGSIY